MISEEETYRFWPHGKAIPDGWEYAGECPGHHAYWSFFIRKKKERDNMIVGFEGLRHGEFYHRWDLPHKSKFLFRMKWGVERLAVFNTISGIKILNMRDGLLYSEYWLHKMKPPREWKKVKASCLDT